MKSEADDDVDVVVVVLLYCTYWGGRVREAAVNKRSRWWSSATFTGLNLTQEMMSK